MAENRRLAEVLMAMASDAGAIDEVVAAARTESPEVSRLPESETRRHVEIMLVAGLAAFSRAPAPDERDFAAAARLGEDRAAQGIPLDALLRGVQAGRSRAVEIAVGRAREAGVPADVLLSALVDFGHFAGSLERHVISGYHAAELELSRTARDLQVHLLRLVLREDAGELTAAELARAGLNPDGLYHCLATDVADPRLARALERWLSPGALFGSVDGRWAAVVPRLPVNALDAAVLVVASPAAPLAELAPLHSLCRAAATAATPTRLHGLHPLTELAGDIALAAQPLLAELLAADLLGTLDPADDFHRQLVSTALAYLDHEQRLDQTAGAMHVHANTVRYRLARLQELTGTWRADDRRTVPQTLRWWWALRTWLNQHVAL
ncbi:helix-turn-helix domain-containing protein [Kribbella sp. CA-294648]|uniref:helix-turn-helix domain-containing protein n=1 Tax=Kribbella sp. CA-294648 TaxID=3239948 RepID=UPI003D937796